MQADNLPPFVKHLLKPASYPHPVDEVSLVQTHISYVLLAGDYVYKFKKPVNFGFLDFTSLEKRKFFCERELELNRRLCPDLYLGLVTVNDDDGLALDGKGTVVEYGIKMARMPEERMMANVIREGKLSKGHIDGIVGLLVPFYQQAATSAEIAGFGTADSVAVNVLENFEQTAGFVDCPALPAPRYQHIKSYAEKFLKRPELFEQRIKAGKIRECHGDLYSANICLDDKIHIYDCIEFNERFRFCDVASDVAFLAMDLDFFGLSELADYFISRFTAASEDPELLTMLNFYKCYRAYVRGKIGLFTAHAPEVDDRTKEKSLAQAAKYFELAEVYASRG